MEFARRPPRGIRSSRSSTLVGVALTCMIIVPTILHFLIASVLSAGLLSVGIMTGMFGLVIRFSAMRTLGRFYSRNIGIQGEHKLIQSGLYRYIRNPGYLGTLIIYLGFAISTSVWLSVLVNLALFFAAYSHCIRVEGQAVVAKFGDAYKDYMGKSWRLIPMLY